MRYIVRKSIIRIVGQIWMPATVCAQVRELSSYDVGNIRGIAAYRLGIDAEELASHSVGKVVEVTIEREDVEQWLMMNSGDFQRVIDFEASIEDGDTTLDFPWSTEDGEMAYCDAMSGDDE